MPSESSIAAGLFVALSASASNTRSLEALLTRVPLTDETAIIVVLQHREALDEKPFKARLAAHERAVTDIADDSLVTGGRVYLAGPRLVVTVEAGRFRTQSAEGQVGERGTIDSFLVSLAREEDGRSIAVVLAGTGQDGTLGFKAVKQAGGLTLAEETEESQFGDLASSNSPAALADAVLSLEDLASRVAHSVRQFLIRDGHPDQPSRAKTDAMRKTIATILRNKTGHDFHGYKSATFVRRVQRRMQVLQVEGIEVYVDALRAQPDEALQLFNDLLIGVTQFFRDGKEFARLERDVIPRLFAGKTAEDQLRIWIIGCSTGEEAYSIGILLREHMATLDVVPQVQLFATDLDGRALAAARAARYANTIIDDVTPERLGRWFVKEGSTYCVVKELREMCIFSQHSIAKDPPFSRLDMVSCRNLLIYLDADLQNRVIPLFYFALKQVGFLFLGNSENVSRHAKLFEPIGSRSRIYRRLETGTRILPDLAFATFDRRHSGAIVPAERGNGENLASRAERFAERYAPAYVIADQDYNVLHFSGRTGRFLDPARGTATLNLLQLVHPDLRTDLRTSLVRAAEANETVQVGNLRMGQGGKRLDVSLVIEPVRDGILSAHRFFVLFKDNAASGEEDVREATASNGHAQTERLEGELRVAKDRLQATVEELESTNEELKSSNEEYQSLNEELQSANEELETSKEELQSVNEELTTVNGELAHRVQELGRANSDLKNFLESTQIATMFLDNDLRVTNHTPSVTEIFHLVESDVGRPISHIKSRIAYDELQDDARRVLRTLGSVERETLNSTTGARYLVRVLPYRSVDNFIAGVVLTFVDITARKQAEVKLLESEGRMRALIEGIPQLVWRAASDGRWTWASPQWCAYTGLTEAESLNLGWLEALHHGDRAQAMAAWSKAVEMGELQIEIRLRKADKGPYRWFQTRATPLRDEAGVIVEWLGTSSDIDDLRRMQEQQAVMVAEMQHRTRNLITVVRSIAQQTMASDGSLEVFKNKFGDRLSALSRVHGLLSRSSSEPITIGALLRLELDALGAEAVGNRFVLEGPDVALRKASVQTLSLAIHELATNALKYGALGVEGGRLEVTWRTYQAEGPRLALQWVERGLLRDQNHSNGAIQGGYGRELIERALPYALDARTSYELGVDALHCAIDLPLTERARAEDD